MSKISIIIPVYKVEPYLRKCLDSVINQTYKNLEIILIDDGSPDNCGKICDEYAETDERIIVIHKENEGLSAGWNNGIEASTGDWIAFVDSDDWIDRLFFEKLLNGAPCANEADVIVANAYYEESNVTVMREQFSSPFFFDNGEGKEYLQLRVFVAPNRKQRYDRMTYVWNKLYNASFIKNGGFIFDEKVRAGLGNDALFNFQVFEKAKNVCGVDYAGYHYRIINTSGTRKFDPNRPQATHYLMDRFYQYMQSNETHPVMWEAFDAYVFGNIISNLMLSCFHIESKEDYHVIADRIREMKKMPRFRVAIFSKNNKYLTPKQRVIKKILQLPFVWPLKVSCTARQRLGRN